MKSNNEFGVVGGGMMGMTIALRLAERGKKVTLFESSSQPGGLASAWEMNGVVWDRFYHVILMSDLFTRKIIKEIGLENDFRWVETKTGFYTNGKLHSMSNLIEFFQFPPINIIDKFRLGLTIFVASRINNWKKLEQIPVEKWLRRWSGNRVFEKIWLPLLKAKLGDHYSETSAAFIWATIQRMYAARKSGLKKEMFGYIKGGYDQVNKSLASHLENNGVRFILNSRVNEIAVQGDQGLSVKISGGDSFRFDAVISTLSPTQSVGIAPTLTDEEKEALKGIKYLGVICPSLLLDTKISDYYVTNITDDWPPFTGIIEMTALIDESEVDGNHLVYLPKYIAPGDPIFDKTDDKIKKEFQDSLLKMYDHITEKNIRFWGVNRARIVFPIPTVGYSTRLPGIKTSLEGFYIVNSSQIINGTLNINETVRIAEEKVKKILDEK